MALYSLIADVPLRNYSLTAVPSIHPTGCWPRCLGRRCIRWSDSYSSILDQGHRSSLFIQQH